MGTSSFCTVFGLTARVRGAACPRHLHPVVRTGPNSPRTGSEYLFGWKAAASQFFTLGLYLPRWAQARFPDLPSVGRFEWEHFDPETWVPEYPNPAFSNMLPDDAFWATRQVMAFRDDEIRAIVKTGRYGDPAAEEWVTRCLIERRNKIGRAFLPKVLPLDRFEVRGGQLVFEDLEVKHGFAAARPYSVDWGVFDNGTGVTARLEGATTFTGPDSESEFLVARIRGADPKKTVSVYLRKRAGRREAVGIERTW